jgi:hypothetical protein
MTSNTVPWELLRAAGHFPVMLNPDGGAVPFADRFMEDRVFGGRIRGIFNGIATAAWRLLKMVVIPERDARCSHRPLERELLLSGHGSKIGTRFPAGRDVLSGLACTSDLPRFVQ